MPAVVATETAAHRSSSALIDALAVARPRLPQPPRGAAGGGGRGGAHGRRSARRIRSRPCLQLVELRLQLVLLGLRQRDEQRLLGEVGGVVEVVLDERLDLRLFQRAALHVDEERAAERRVGAVLHRLGARRDAASAAVDLDALELVSVLLEVGEAEVAEAALVARDALDGDVVVLGGVVVGAARALLAVDLVGEEVERAGVGAGAVERQLLVREGRVDLVPVVDLRARVPDRSSAGRPSGTSPSRSPG